MTSAAGIAEVNLMLARRHLVVRRLHLEAHELEAIDDDTADLLALVHRAEVEVAGEVVRAGGGRAVGRLLEEEELRLAARHHLEAELPGAGDLALQRVAGTAVEGSAVRGVDVADEPGHPAALFVERQHAEGGRDRA